jgi:peptidoglycan/LPS O-acetylase OafA/YrhL
LPSAGRVTVGFYLGLFLRRSIDSHGVKAIKSLNLKFTISVLLIALNFFLMTISDWFIIFAGINFYFAISLISNLDETKFPKGTSRVCLYLGRISYGFYVWNIVIGKMHISSFLDKHCPSVGIGFFHSAIVVFFSLALIWIATELSIIVFENPVKKQSIKLKF